MQRERKNLQRLRVLSLSLKVTRDIHIDELRRKFSYANEFQPIRGADDVFHTNKKGYGQSKS